MPKKSSQLGKLAPQYNFFLNPYKNERFTRCPQCENKMGQKKLPLVIHVDPHYPLNLNYTCRFCAHCDLLIVHQDEIEELLAKIFSQNAPEAVGNEYLILGTVDHAYWKAGLEKPHMPKDLLDNLHDFKEVLKFERTGGWVFDETKSAPKQTAPQVKPKRPTSASQVGTVDNVAQAMALVEKIKAALPMTMQPTKALIRIMRQHGVSVSPGQALTVKDVLYMGDEGGISCAITPPGKPKEVLVCSLTQLEVARNNPLSREMRTYQQKRQVELARQKRASVNSHIGSTPKKNG